MESALNPTNPVKKKLAAGERVIGCFIPPASPEIVEICALAGFDFALLDAEHGAISPATAYPMILAAEARGIPAFARIGQIDKQVILKFLDLGITGVMAPQVNSAEQAASAIAATRYFPDGNRGLAGGRTFDYALTEPAAEMAPKLNDRILTMIQFEHVDTLKELDAILRLEHLDVLFIGPNDLAQSLGFTGQPGHPEVTRVADEVVARAKAAGVRTGTVAPTIESAQSVFARGFDMAVANAPGLLASAATAYLKAARQS
jgi:4-hydroxy-2-oxoheptanedioate aldolase